MLTTRDWALNLWDLGYQTIITPLRAKRPNIPWKRWQDERVPRAQVEEWYSEGQHNIAILTGALTGLVVVDGDSKDACTYIESICAATPFKVLSSKGAHYYYRHPGGKVPNAVRVTDTPPVDLRGDGGLIIGPGSLHASNVYYRLPKGSDLTSVQDLPLFRREWFQLEEARIIEFKRPALRFHSPEQKDSFNEAQRYLSSVPGAIQGNGGDVHTYIQACRLVRGFNLTDDEALSLLHTWNQRCEPPWSEADLVAKIKHARAYGTGEFGSKLSRNHKKGLLCFGWPA